MGGVLSAIAAGPRPVDIDPTLMLKRRVMLGDLQAQQQERIAQAQALQAQAQIRQQAFADQNALRRVYVEDGGWNSDTSPVKAAQYGASPDAIDKMQTAHDKHVTDLLANDKTKNELVISHAEQASRALDGISQIPPDQRGPAIAQFWTNASKWLPPDELKTAQQTFGAMDDQSLSAFKATMDYNGKLAAEANARKQTDISAQQAATAAAREQREGQTSAAALPGVQADAQLKQLRTQAMQEALKDPTKGAAAIDAALPPTADPAANQGYKAAWTAAMQAGSPEAAAKIVEAAAQHAASLSPATTAKKVQDAVSIERAITPLKIAQQVATARAMRQGDNPALAGVAPADIPRVNSSAQKLDQDYIKAKTSAEDIETVLNLATAGNKAAGANVPLVGVGALNAINGIKRINSAEIAQYGTAGSLLDKIQGKLQGWTEGQPIPKDVLSDMKALHDQLAQGSWRTYTQGLDAINKRSGAKLAPTVDAPKSISSAVTAVPDPVKTLLGSAAVKPGIHTLSDGSKWMKAKDGTITPQ